MNNGIFIYAKMDNRFTISKKISGEANLWYFPTFHQGLFQVGEAYSLDLAISFKSLLKGLNVTVGGYDVFNTSSSLITTTVNDIKQNIKQFTSEKGNRYFKVSLKYQFGNKKAITKDRSFGNEDIRERSDK